MGNGVDVGPFAAKRQGAVLVSFLEDAFDLCRYYDELEKAPRGRACDYFDMGRCPGPCDGSISSEQYGKLIDASRRYALGGVAEFLQVWNERMQASAASKSYREAARWKELRQRAERTDDASGRLGSYLEAFRFVVIQKGSGRRMVKPWFVAAGEIEEGEAVSVDNASCCWEAWLDRVKGMEVCQDRSMVERSELVWLVCHFLGKGSRASGLFLPANEVNDSGKVSQMIGERFK
jgi:excinuclease UvrABC nuclease subunit